MVCLTCKCQACQAWDLVPRLRWPQKLAIFMQKGPRIGSGTVDRPELRCSPHFALWLLGFAHLFKAFTFVVNRRIWKNWSQRLFKLDVEAVAVGVRPRAADANPVG